MEGLCLEAGVCESHSLPEAELCDGIIIFKKAKRGEQSSLQYLVTSLKCSISWRPTHMRDFYRLEACPDINFKMEAGPREISSSH